MQLLFYVRAQFKPLARTKAATGGIFTDERQVMYLQQSDSDGFKYKPLESFLNLIFYLWVRIRVILWYGTQRSALLVFESVTSQIIEKRRENWKRAYPHRQSSVRYHTHAKKDCECIISSTVVCFFSLLHFFFVLQYRHAAVRGRGELHSVKKILINLLTEEYLCLLGQICFNYYMVLCGLV